MIRFLIRLAVNLAVTIFAFWVAVQILPGMSFTGNLGNWLVVAIIFGVVNAIIRPNALMLWLTSWISGALTVDGFITAFLGALIIAIVSTIINWFIPD
jgi:putative membrane protein